MDEPRGRSAVQVGARRFPRTHGQGAAAFRVHTRVRRGCAEPGSHAEPRPKMSFLRGKTAKGMLRTPGSSDSMYQKTVIDNVLLKPYTTLEVNSAPEGGQALDPSG